MFIGTGTITMRANWCHSLKEKRMVIKSIVDKTKHKFNISIAEIGDQDLHNSIIIGFACVNCDKNIANSMVNKVINYIEYNTEADILNIEIEVI